MYTLFLSLIDYVKYRDIHFFVCFMGFILLRWVVIFFNSLLYRPFVGDGGKLFTTVIVPVVDEPERLFREVIQRIIIQRPNEIVVVVNGPHNPPFLNLCEELKKQTEIPFKVLYTPIPGKRNAIRLGVEEASPDSDVTILVDSDTLWTEGTLREIVKPFAADKKIGGVTTRQKISKPERSFSTIFAALLEEVRAEGTMKAMSVYGKVGCLPGRTIAFRTQILRDSMNEFLTETFFGIHREVSDDRSLTNLTLKAGYKTVMQDTALVYTDAPITWGKFFRQQLRWATGSQYYNLRMTGWMLKRAWLMLFIFWTDMLLPFLVVSLLVTNAVGFVLSLTGHTVYTLSSPYGPAPTLLLVAASTIFGFGARNIRIIKHIPLYWVFFFPIVILVLSFFMVPLRLIGLARCADEQAWGTRELGDAVAVLSDRPVTLQTSRKSPWRIVMRLAVVLSLGLFIGIACWIEFCF